MRSDQMPNQARLSADAMARLARVAAQVSQRPVPQQIQGPSPFLSGFPQCAHVAAFDVDKALASR